jgi:hypothetical protein
MTSHSITGGQIAAARALTGVSQERLAVRAKVELPMLRRLEATGPRACGHDENAEKIRHALQELGAIFIDEKDGAGAGVRLKFSRGQTHAIDTWENEGGIVADDDVP